MCFSVEADLAAAAAITPVAVVALRMAPTRRHLAIASLPAIFAAHQLIEVFVWLRFDGDVSQAVADTATQAYLAIAQILLPLLVPVAIALVEPDRRRRAFMGLCMVAGVLVAARFAWVIFGHDVGATRGDHVIIYTTDVHIGVWTTIGYVVATCLPVLASSRRPLVVYGVVNAIGLALAASVRYSAVTSVWCLYAALASVLIIVLLRGERRRLRAEGVRPSQGAPAGQGEGGSGREVAAGG